MSDRKVESAPIESLRGIQEILRKRLESKPVEGEVNIQDLARDFGEDNGTNFQGRDGFYHLTGAKNPSEGDLVRIKTVGSEKTLWYPANTQDLIEAIELSKNEIRRAAQGTVWDSFTELPKGTKVGELLEEAEEKATGEYHLVDFGSGDGRVLMLASALGIPSKGIEIDTELSQMSDENIAEAGKNGYLRASISTVQGSFFDEQVLHDVITDEKRPRTVAFLYVTPNTWALIPQLLPHLKKDDIVITYKERLSHSPEFENVKPQLARVNEYFLMEAPVSSYTVK